MVQFETRWQAPEFEYHPKGVSWYWISIIVAAAIIAFAIWERDFLFGVFILIAEVLFIAWGNEMPPTVNFVLTEKNLDIDDAKRHPIGLFENFSVNELDDDWVELFFAPKAKLRTPVKIMVPKIKLEEIRKNLQPILREVNFEPSLLDALEKIIGF